MRKGKFGVSYAAYAVLAMFMAIFSVVSSYTFIIPLVGLTVFVAAAEKDDWTTRACFQADAVVGIFAIYNTVISLFNKLFNIISDAKYNAYTNYNGDNYKKARNLEKAYSKFNKFQNKWNDVIDIIDLIVIVLLLVLLVMAIFKVAKNLDPSIPVASKFATFAVGMASIPPMNNNQMPQMAPMGQSGFCPTCGNAVNGSFCTTCGNKVQ